MAEQFEIVLTERGGAGATPQQQPSAPSESPLERTPGPSDKVTGPKKPDNQGVGRDLENAAQKIATALGIGGLTGTAIELRKAFGRLYESVTAAEKAVEAKRRADTGASGVTGEVKGPPAKTGLPNPSEPTAPPVTAKPPGLAVPKVGTFERQSAKGDIPAPPVTRAVTAPIPSIGWFERTAAAKGTAVAPPVAVSGVPVAPPVVGPQAGAGATEAGMARLAAAAGPAAIAVGALTIAVVGGAVAIKKTFDLMNSEANRLAGLSGALSASTSLNSVRAEFADIRRAQRIGPQLANVNDASGQIQAKIADINTELLRVVVNFADAFRPLVPLLTNTLDLIAAGIPVTTDTMIAIIQFLQGKLEPALELDAKERANLARLASSINRLITNEVEDRKAMAEDPFAAAFLGNFGQRPEKPQAQRAPPKKAPNLEGKGKPLPGSGFLRTF
jgi:hypothetical protein